MKPYSIRRSLVALLLCLTVLNAPCAAGEDDAAREYQRRLREARGGRPGEWLRLAEWAQAQEGVTERVRDQWIRHSHQKYGVALAKRIKNDDVRGWIDLARTLERLMDSDSVSKSYLRRALRNNPGHPLLLKAMGTESTSKEPVPAGAFAERKKAADAAGTAGAFRALAAWCAGQRAEHKQAATWYAYARAREVHISGRSGGPDDPILRAVLDGEAKRDARTPVPVTDVPSYLPLLDFTFMTAAEAGNAKEYRLIVDGQKRYASGLPASEGPEAAWERGRKRFQNEEREVWIRLQWDSESAAWVDFTRADRRAARAKRIAYARDQVARAERQMAEAILTAQLPSGDPESALARATEIARKGGRLEDFRRALETLREGGSIERRRFNARSTAERAVEAWKAKLAELESGT